MPLPKITLLHQDLDTLLNAWAHTPATPAQHRRWPPERTLFHRQLGQDQPDTLRLLAEDGGDGEPVFSVKARTVQPISATVSPNIAGRASAIWCAWGASLIWTASASWRWCSRCSGSATTWRPNRPAVARCSMRCRTSARMINACC